MAQKPSFFDILDNVINRAAEVATCSPSRVFPNSILTQDPLRLTQPNMADLAQKLDDDYKAFKLAITGNDIAKQTYIIQVADLVATKIGVPIPNSAPPQASSPVLKALKLQAANLQLKIPADQAAQVQASAQSALGLAAANAAKIDTTKGLPDGHADLLIRGQQAKLMRKKKTN